MGNAFKLLALPLTLLLTGCFDFSETITLKKDGSGHYTYKLDATEFYNSMLAMAQSADTTLSGDNPQLMRGFDSSNRAHLEKLALIKGLTNLKADTSVPNIYIIDFDFTSVAVINEAIRTCFNDRIKGDIYTFKKKNLTRSGQSASSTVDFENEEVFSEETASYFGSGRYNLNIFLPKKCKSSGNTGATISKNQVSFSSNLDSLYNKNSSLAYSLKY